MTLKSHSNVNTQTTLGQIIPSVTTLEVNELILVHILRVDFFKATISDYLQDLLQFYTYLLWFSTLPQCPNSSTHGGIQDVQHTPSTMEKFYDTDFANLKM